MTVADSGPGISPDQLPHVFDRFFQANQSNGAQRKGAGLGLSIAQRIFQLHDGVISVDSAPGAGARFTFQLAANTGLEG